jgi:colicin import membrane protein
MPPKRDVAHDIHILQAFTTWLLTVAVDQVDTVKDDLTGCMFKAYYAVPGHTDVEDVLRRVKAAAYKAETSVIRLQRDKENIASNAQLTLAAQPPTVHNTRRRTKQVDELKAEVEAVTTAADTRYNKRAAHEITQMQLNFLKAYRAAQAAIDEHTQAIRAQNREDKKQAAELAAQQAREQKAYEQAEVERKKKEAREAADKARADNTERSRELNKRAAELNIQHSRNDRAKRMRLEEKTEQALDTYLVITQAIAQRLSIDLPAAAAERADDAQQIEQPHDTEPA